MENHNWFTRYVWIWLSFSLFNNCGFLLFSLLVARLLQSTVAHGVPHLTDPPFFFGGGSGYVHYLVRYLETRIGYRVGQGFVSRNAHRNMCGRAQGEVQLLPGIGCWNETIPEPKSQPHNWQPTKHLWGSHYNYDSKDNLRRQNLLTHRYLQSYTIQAGVTPHRCLVVINYKVLVVRWLPLQLSYVISKIYHCIFGLSATKVITLLLKRPIYFAVIILQVQNEGLRKPHNKNLNSVGVRTTY